MLDRVDILGAVRRVMPTERARPFALPVGVEATLMVRGTPIAIGIRLDDLAATEEAFWIGARDAGAPSRSSSAACTKRNTVSSAAR